MNTQRFKDDIKQWIVIDKELERMNMITKQLRQQKQGLEASIIQTTDNENISGLSIKTEEGLLKFAKSKYTKPLTFGYLKGCLSNVLDSEDHVSHVIQYIKENRDFTYNITLKKV